MNDDNRPPLAERPKIRLAAELPTMNHEAQDEEENSEYQVLWSNTMDEGKYKSSSTYTNANVLLVCWSESSDDLCVKEEVTKLKDTFETRLKYNAEIAYLEATASRRLQVQVNGIVQRFIDAHDGPNTLLIVYYAGHGKPGKYYGSLELHGLVGYGYDASQMLTVSGQHRKTSKGRSSTVWFGTGPRSF